MAITTPSIKYYAEFQYANVIMLSGFVAYFNVMLTVIKLNVVMPSVVAAATRLRWLRLTPSVLGKFQIFFRHRVL
jgi:hypothetical protein